MSANSIFFLGATGYVGSGVLAKLLEYPAVKPSDITVITRSAPKAKTLGEKFGLKTVVGSTDDEEKLVKLVSEAHVVISTADSDNMPAIKTILRGMKERHTKTGDVPILIHTSGTGVLITNDQGNVVGQNVYDDADPASIASIPDAAPHRDVDLAVVAADKAGYLKSYIVLPSTIYGTATHAIAKAGISNKHSIQIPALIKTAVARGASGVVGKGVPIWSGVETSEVSDLYIKVLDGVLNNNPAVGHGADGFYFGLNGDYTWIELAQEIGRVLKQKGKINSAEPTQFTSEELVKYFGSPENGAYFGSTSRGIANHSKVIGWKPVKTTKDMLASITPEVEALFQ